MAMKHEGCGGELRKHGKVQGRYRCVVCRTLIKIGVARGAGRFGFEGYVKQQLRKVR